MPNLIILIVYKSPTTTQEFKDYFLFRWEMLRKPLGLPRGSEQDELEKSAFHIAAYHDQNVIGVGRIHIEPDKSARIRYMAVHDDYQRQGISSSILRELEQIAHSNDVQVCWLYAREVAIPLYIHNGYKIEGDSKSELLALKHQRMEKFLR